MEITKQEIEQLEEKLEAIVKLAKSGLNSANTTYEKQRKKLIASDFNEYGTIAQTPNGIDLINSPFPSLSRCFTTIAAKAEMAINNIK